MQQIYISDVLLAQRRNTSRATVWRHVKSGALPKPVKLSDGCTRWLLSEVEAFEQKQITARSTDTASRSARFKARAAKSGAA